MNLPISYPSTAANPTATTSSSKSSSSSSQSPTTVASAANLAAVAAAAVAAVANNSTVASTTSTAPLYGADLAATYSTDPAVWPPTATGPQDPATLAYLANSAAADPNVHHSNLV